MTHTPGIQLYSVREALNANPAHCIETLAKIGFKRAEGFDLMQLAQIQPLLRQHHIEVNSSFVLWSHITGNYELAEQINYPWIPPRWGIDYLIDNANNLGLDTLVLGYLLPQERTQLDDFKRIVEQMNMAGEACKKAGLQFLYHNHAFEFAPLENTVPYFYMLENTSAETVNFELDILWSQLGGYSATELFARYPGRFTQLHLKTSYPVDTPFYDDQLLTENKQDCPLGQGVVDAEAVLKGYTGDISKTTFIEQEYGSHLYQSLRTSLDWIQGLSVFD